MRKHPVTPKMCDWLGHLQSGLGLDSVIKRAARYLAIFQGCRCSEHLGPGIHWGKVIFVSCVRQMHDGVYCGRDEDFGGFMVTFRGTKTDQYTADFQSCQHGA